MGVINVLPLLLLPLLLPSTLGSDVGEVRDIKIESHIVHRYATTRVSTTLYNPRPSTSTLHLHLALPPAALLSGLVIEAEGRNYSGRVYDRGSANRVFESARRGGKATALLQLGDEDVQRVSVRASVPALRYLTFHVTYEHLVRRVDGSYIYTLPVKPGQRVHSVEINVFVKERENITDLRVLELPGQEMRSPSPGSSVTGGPTGPGELHVKYQHQRTPHSTSRGVDGTFTLSYTTETFPDGGELQREGQFFAHYFSPGSLPALRSHTVFILDVSRSMKGMWLTELKAALSSSFHSVHPDDSYEILVFSTDVVSLGTFHGRRREVRRAVKRVRRLKALGDSDINSALLQAIENSANHKGTQSFKQIVVFSDGKATSGETGPMAIRKNINETNTERIPIFSFVFGDGSTKLLEWISSDNDGFSHKTHHSPSLAEQIQMFLKSLASPMVANVNVQYQGVEPGSLVRAGTENYYAGDELVFVGQLAGHGTPVGPRVTGRVEGEEGEREFPITRHDTRHSHQHHQDNAVTEDNTIARLWALLRVQDFLSRAESSENREQSRELQSQASRLAQEFSFVTRLTSLVAVYPDASLLLTRPNEVKPWPDFSPGPPQQVAAAYTGSRRPGRSYMRNNRPRTFVDLDPHFLVRAEGMEPPICFYLHSQRGAFVSLVRDPQSDIIINGEMTSSPGRPLMTFFTSLFLRLGGVNITISTDHINIDCLADDGSPQVNSITNSLWPFYKKNGRRYKYRVDKKLKRKKGQRSKKHNNTANASPNPGPSHYQNSNKNYYYYNGASNLIGPRRVIEDGSLYNCHLNTTWEAGVGRIYGEVMVAMTRKRHLQLTLGDGLADITIVRSGHKKYLGLYINQQRVLSPESQGIIGELLSKRLRLVSGSPQGVDNSSSGRKSRVEVEVGGGNRSGQVVNGEGGGVVSGVLVRRRSLLAGKHTLCININTRHTALLQRPPQHYLLHCLSC